MFEIYRNTVLAFYHQQIESGILGHLSEPSPGVLREECLTANQERSLENETHAVKVFFGSVGADGDSYRRAIENIDLERLKPLQRFMIGETTKPQVAVVEFLAWLVDFEDRPYHPGWVSKTSVNSGGKSKNLTNKSIDKLQIWQHPAFISGNIILTLILFGYLIWQINFNTSSSTPKPNEKCMYWTGTHFAPIDCNTPTDVIKERLDVDRMHGFKKILIKDLLTKNDIGKVYLLNGPEGPEYFTQNGIYPENPAKKLRPLSSYMLAKYTSFYRFLLWFCSAVILVIVAVLVIVKTVYWFHEKKQRSRMLSKSEI
ncbi:MAG: hypothetical protein EOO07_11040 [Chitinophagaceae bacterium]|nr:MAG: hypothetical protein EOO07_11040 [Chitinophagaceae bacterium]